jgi:phosphoribosyl-ATP pyrophosphohydrolase/phosphoribosyl-AMP cyclohydrolase
MTERVTGRVTGAEGAAGDRTPDVAAGVATAIETGVAWGTDGLVPAVVQDVVDGRVLMVAYMDAEALAATLATGEVHFHSRSRGRLWKKGETSGHVLGLRGIALDCDADSLLLTVEPHGPTCHRGTRSCFDQDEASSERRIEGFGWLEELWATIDERATARPSGSYTVELLEGGVDAVGRKVVEEATEVLIAAKDDAMAPGDGRAGTQAALSGEVADLLYHALVLLAERRLPPADVIAVLRDRHGPRRAAR